MTTAHDYAGKPIPCPTCGFERVHPVAVEVDRGGEVVQVDADGVGFARRTHRERGVIIRLNFVCEQGHPFYWRLQFSKGTTYFLKEGIDMVVMDPSMSWPRTIWRD